MARIAGRREVHVLRLTNAAAERFATIRVSAAEAPAPGGAPYLQRCGAPLEAGLQLEETVVRSLLHHKFVVGTLFDNFAFIHNDDPVAF